MFSITIEVDGYTAIQTTLGTLRSRITDSRVAFQQIRSDFYIEEREQFDSRGARGGTAWAPLSTSYARWKARQTIYPGIGIMELSRDLRISLTREGSYGSIYRPSRGVLELGTSIPYARAHQRGRGVPVRRIIEVTPQQRNRWVAIIRNNLFRGI